MRTLGFIIISLLFTYSAISQDIRSDTVRGKFAPTGVRIGFDLISFGEAVIKSEDFREIQFSADIDFYRYFLNVEYGIFDREWQREGSAIYTNEGNHYKIGPDVNFLHRDPDGNALFFGFRYAFANFSDKLSYTYASPVYGNGAGELENNKLKASWLELTTGLKVKLTRIIWMGYTARFKFSGDTFEDKQLIPHWVPGYGRADETSNWGFDYWLIVRVPFKKKPKPSQDN